MEKINLFVANLPDHQGRIVLSIHDWLTTYPGMECKIRYKIPFFYRKSWICYTNPQKHGGVELAFIRAVEFEDPTGMLESKGRKMVAGLTIEDSENIPFDKLDEILQQALWLDDNRPYRGPQKK